jgi:DNA-binding Lrp family transcriptional regulator
MKRVKFSEESKRLNVSIEAIVDATEKLLCEGKVDAIIDKKNEEFIYYKPEEMENLTRLLKSKRVLIKEIADELNLRTDQVHLIIDKLLKENKIKGIFTYDDEFISDTVMRNLVVDIIEETERIDIKEISSRLSVPEGEIRSIIEMLGKQVIIATTPFRQIKFTDLSHEVKLPERSLVAFLKMLISEGQLAGSLDMVNRIFISERMVASLTITPSKPVEKGKVESRKEIGKAETVSKPSNAWYLVPLFLGIIGGAIAYLAIKDEDEEMANNLLYIGIFMTFLGLIIILGYFSTQMRPWR